MGEFKKLIIGKPEDGGFIVNTGGRHEIGVKNLADILSTEDLSQIEKLQYEKLKPIGFDYAPESAKQKREDFKKTNNIKKLQWMHDNVSYNADHTMNIISLKKTFCEDISGQNQNFKYDDAKKLAENTGYELGTDYNYTDSKSVKQNSDWFKVINIFSENQGDTTEGMAMFRDMAGCCGQYWTATGKKDEKGNKEKDVVRCRILKNLCARTSNVTYYISLRVCGFKDSMNVAQAA